VSVGTTRVLRADAGALDAVADYRAARERGEWRRLLLPGADLRDTDMSGLDLDECDLTGAVLDGAQFVGASLVRSCLAGASLLGADFSYANLDRADLERADATAAAFVNATLRRADLTGCRLHRADLSDADLSRANLYESNLTAANLNGALAAQANLRGAVLEDAVLTAMRGEPLFDSPNDPLSPEALFGWPAARLAGSQLVELAELYLNTQGWGTIEPSSWGDEGIDLMAQRDDATVMVQVKATATPSPQNFTYLAQRLKRTTEGHPNARLILVLPGPVPQSIQDLARANRISVLGVWVEKNTMRIEEVVDISGDPLRESA
jgi:Pentapeptide repeats (8 copies)